MRWGSRVVPSGPSDDDQGIVLMGAEGEVKPPARYMVTLKVDHGLPSAHITAHRNVEPSEESPDGKTYETVDFTSANQPSPLGQVKLKWTNGQEPHGVLNAKFDAVGKKWQVKMRRCGEEGEGQQFDVPVVSVIPLGTDMSTNLTLTSAKVERAPMKIKRG